MTAKKKSEDVTPAENNVSTPAQTEMEQPKNAKNARTQAAKSRKAPKRKSTAPAKPTETEGEADTSNPIETAEDRKIAAVIDETGDRSAALRDARVRDAERQREQAIRTKTMSDWMSMKAAMRMQHILHGSVIATLKRKLKGGHTVIFAVASVENTNFQALIPFSEFYRDDPIKPDSSGSLSIEQRQEQMLAKHLGAPITFIVTDLNTVTNNHVTTYGVVASRKKALALEDRVAFSRTPPYIEKGMLVSATILAVSRQALLVNICGIDTRVPKRLLSNRYMLTADAIDPNTGRPYYSIGDKIDVIVTDIRERSDGLHDLVLSGAEAELQNIIINGPPIPVGMKTTAVLTRLFPAKKDPSKAIIYAFNEHFKLPIVIGRFSTKMICRDLRQGDVLRVQITNYSANGYAIALCRGIQSSNL